MRGWISWVLRRGARGFCSRSPKVGNPIASTSLRGMSWEIPALFGLDPVSNFMGFTVQGFSYRSFMGLEGFCGDR